MKRHHLTFEGQPLDTVIGIRKYVDTLKSHIETHPASDEVIAGALAECFASIAGDAIERKRLSIDTVRSLLSEQRIVIQRRVERPSLSKLEMYVLAVVARSDNPLNCRALEARTNLPRTTINSATRSLMLKGKIARRIDGKLVCFVATESGLEALGPEADASGQATEIPTPRIIRRGARSR
jgi:hypothetical protein